MEYFRIERTNKTYNLDKKITFKKGYKFKRKINITLYNKSITEEILIRKINNAFKNIWKLISCLDEDDDTSAAEIRIKIDTLRNLILKDYYIHIGKNRTKVYLLKLDELKSRIPEKKTKKTRSR